MKGPDKLLTELELKVMHLLWEQSRAFVRELLSIWKDDPVPAYNTVSTVLRILEEKGYVAHEALGRSHRYYPLIDREAYQQKALGSVIDQVFEGSMGAFVSALVENRELSGDRAKALRGLIEAHRAKNSRA